MCCVIIKYVIYAQVCGISMTTPCSLRRARKPSWGKSLLRYHPTCLEAQPRRRNQPFKWRNWSMTDSWLCSRIYQNGRGSWQMETQRRFRQMMPWQESNKCSSARQFLWPWHRIMETNYGCRMDLTGNGLVVWGILDSIHQVITIFTFCFDCV